MLTRTRRKNENQARTRSFDPNEETVSLFLKSEITHKGAVPRYAWFKTVNPVRFKLQI